MEESKWRDDFDRNISSAEGFNGILRLGGESSEMMLVCLYSIEPIDEDVMNKHRNKKVER